MWVFFFFNNLGNLIVCLEFKFLGGKSNTFRVLLEILDELCLCYIIKGFFRFLEFFKIIREIFGSVSFMF